MTADAAVRGIRELDADGSIALISDEPHPPYKRPPLSKGLWSGKTLESIWSRTADRDVELYLGRSARALDLENKRVVDDDGSSYGYDRLLLATGSTPRTLPFNDDRIIYFRTLNDYQRLRELTDGGEHFAVIGGGFIGSEIAAALALNGKRVTLIFPDDAIGTRMYPRDLALSLNDYYRDRGVEVLAGTTVVGVERRGDQSVVTVRDADARSDREIVVDGVVAGIGAQPNVDLARNSGLEVADGIVVDHFLRTSHPDVYAAGDVANFLMPVLGERRRVEHEDNAKTMGAVAGRAMAGRLDPYDHLPFFYSDLFDLGYEAVGDLDSRLETVANWTEPFREGVVYYLRDGRVRGVLLWNVWGQVDAARKLVRHSGPADLHGLMGGLLVNR
jgi:NADPH-dependent 2,4-dienoyl-CoA reductase/sulfur reductase-like enzyme